VWEIGYEDGRYIELTGACPVADFGINGVEPSDIRVIKSRRMRWVGHITHMGEVRNAYSIFCWKTGREQTTWKT